MHLNPLACFESVLYTAGAAFFADRDRAGLALDVEQLHKRADRETAQKTRFAVRLDHGQNFSGELLGDAGEDGVQRLPAPHKPLVLCIALLVGKALSGIFGVALYRYALDGQVLGGFTEADLESAVKPKRGAKLPPASSPGTI